MAGTKLSQGRQQGKQPPHQGDGDHLIAS